MRAFSRTFLPPSTVANNRGLKSIAVALCFGITICQTAIANHDTVTYSWTGTIDSVEVDNGTGFYAGTQIGDTFEGTFTFDPDVANITGLVTSDGDSVIEPGDVWVEYFPVTDHTEIRYGRTELFTTEVILSITTDSPIDDPDEQEFISNLFGKEVALGTLVDSWGLGSGGRIESVTPATGIEIEIEYLSLLNMQDDLSFRPNPPWSPPRSPDDPDNQVAIFKISQGEIFLAYGIITMAQAQLFAVEVGQIDDFEDGGTAGWHKGLQSTRQPTNISTGGPSGANDNYLRTVSTGGDGPNSKQVIFNCCAIKQWTADYLAAGVTEIAMHFRNSGSSTLHMRIAFGGLNELNSGATWFASTQAIQVPADSNWHEASFSISESDLTRVSGSLTYAEALSHVGELRILHSQSGPDLRGDSVVSTLGVDNIEAKGVVDSDGDGVPDNAASAVIINLLLDDNP